MKSICICFVIFEVMLQRHDPPDPQQQQSSAIEPRFIGPRPSSDVASAASTGDSSASSSGGAGRPNIPIERTRLSQIAEQRRSQDLQKLKHHGEEAQKSLHQTQVPVTTSGKPLPPTPGSNRQTSAPRGRYIQLSCLQLWMLLIIILILY